MKFTLEHSVLFLLVAPTQALAQTTVLASVNNAGVPSNGSNENTSISLDGRFVMFTSRATNLVPNDIDALNDATCATS